MREWISKMLYGRNGADRYSRFLTCTACAVLLIGVLLRGFLHTLCWLIAIALAGYATFRIYSRQLDKRRAENARYLRVRSAFIKNFRLHAEQWKQRKEYKFFKCPACKTTLRVPRHKGKIRVVCRRCGNSFETKT